MSYIKIKDNNHVGMPYLGIGVAANKSSMGATETSAMRLHEFLISRGVIIKDASICVSIRYPAKSLEKGEHEVVWLHDLPGKYILTSGMLDIIYERAKSTTLVFPSQYHKTIFVDTVRALVEWKSWPSMQVIPNPIDESAYRNPCKDRGNYVMWAAAPQKGLEHAVRIFNMLAKHERNLHFLVATPEYALKELDKYEFPNNTQILGAVPHDKLLDYVYRARLLLHANLKWPETFGVLLAESNALGTPVLTQNHGAAREVLHDKRQLVDFLNESEAVGRALSIITSDIEVSGRPEHRESAVMKKWEELFLSIEARNKK